MTSNKPHFCSLGLTWLLAAVATALALTACGGGGGATPAERTGISEAYYPMAIGARWVYDLTETNPAASFVDDTVVTGTRTVGGLTAWVMRDSNPGGDGVAAESYYAKDARAFTYLADNSGASWLTAAMGPFDLMRFDGSFSATPLLERTDVDIGEDLDGDGRNERFDVTVNGVVEGTETFVSNLGRFADTARLRYDVAGTLRLTTGARVPLTEVIRVWRAPGVGALRQTLELTALGVASSQTMELRAFSVNGLAGGLLPPQALLGGLAPGDSDETNPGRPALATDGQRHLLVSNRQTAGGRQWIGQFLGADGRLQGGLDLSAPLGNNTFQPAVASNGSGFLVVTAGDDGLKAQRLNAAGGLVDAYPGLALAADGFSPAVAWGGGTYLVVYLRSGGLYGLRVSPAGAVSSEFLIAPGPAVAGWPALAFDGANFLVAWEAASIPWDPAGADIRAIRVSPQGGLVDVAPIAVSTASEAQTAPQVACDAVNCLVAWVDRRGYPGQSYSFSPGPGDLYGAFVSRAGVVLNGPSATGGLPLAIGVTANAGYPALAFSGSDYVLAWSRGAYVNNPGGPTGIYAVRVALDGTVTPAAPGLVVSGPPPEFSRLHYPVVSATATGVLVAWLQKTELPSARKAIVGTVIRPALAR